MNQASKVVKSRRERLLRPDTGSSSGSCEMDNMKAMLRNEKVLRIADEWVRRYHAL